MYMGIFVFVCSIKNRSIMQGRSVDRWVNNHEPFTCEQTKI